MSKNSKLLKLLQCIRRESIIVVKTLNDGRGRELSNGEIAFWNEEIPKTQLLSVKG